MPFVKPETRNDVVGAGTEYGVGGDHGPVELVLYRKLYDIIGAPPVSVGGAHVTKTCWLSHTAGGIITGAIGIVEGANNITLEGVPVPTILTPET